MVKGTSQAGVQLFEGQDGRRASLQQPYLCIIVGIMTRAWIVRWTVVTATSLALCVGAFIAGPGGGAVAAFMVGFLGLFIAGMVVADKPSPRSRYLPAIIAPAVVGIWPAYRAIAVGDTRTGLVFLALLGFQAGMIAFGVAHGFVRSRGWVVDTPSRRRAGLALLLVLLAKNLIEKKWPVLQYDFITHLVFALMCAVSFWPSRARLGRAALTPPSPRHPA